MKMKGLSLLAAGIYLVCQCTVALDWQNEIILPIPQAQELWDSRQILGNSTAFNHPLDTGTCKLSLNSFLRN